jgi:CRP-like cAMP-binding protein
VEALRACVALTLTQGEVRRMRSLPAAALLAVEDGFVVVRRTVAPPRRSFILDEAAAGAMLLPPTADEELVALVPSCVRIISPAALDHLMSSEEAQPILNALTSALRRRDELTASLSNARHIERVREKFLQLARDYGTVDAEGVRIDLPLTHELLAEMVCSARETVTRAVDELEREGFVTRRAGGYRIAVDAELLV